MYSGINGAFCNKTKQTPRTFVYIFFFSGIKLFSLVVLHLYLFFPPNLFLPAVVIDEWCDRKDTDLKLTGTKSNSALKLPWVILGNLVSVSLVKNHYLKIFTA